jgi:hypothetical protein
MRHQGGKRFLGWWVVAATASATALPAASQACRVNVPPTLEDVRFADVVVVGRVLNYRIVRDEAFRRRMLASPPITAELRRMYEDPRESLLPDYARFEVQVEEVLVGSPPSSFSVTWDNSTFAEPDQMGPGPYLIALHLPASAGRPLRGPSAAIFATPDPKTLTLLQASCSSPFIYEVASEQARTIRNLLDVRAQ